MKLKNLILLLAVLVWSETALGQTRVARDLVVFYDFTEESGVVIKDKTYGSQSLDLTIQHATAVEWLKPGLRVKTATLAKALADRTKLSAADFFARGITIEAWIKPLNNTQGGPARIVTFSQDSAQRNFTLGQAGNYYQQRFRTSATNPNGSNIAAVTPANSIAASPALQHVVYTRDATGATIFYIDKKNVGTLAVPGDERDWVGTYGFGLFNEMNYPTDTRTWLGDIFLVAIYTTALTAAEVAQNFDAGVPKMPVLGAGEITLAWDANTEPDLAGYNIYWGLESGRYDGTVDVGSISTCATPYDPFKIECCEITLTGFELGKTYYFVATAYDEDDNESGYSEELTYTFKKTMTPPVNLRER